MTAVSSAQSAKHSDATVEHYTPKAIIDAAREAMGGRIDLDPASCLEANRALVQARGFYSEKDNGLLRPWQGNVWLNPPGGALDENLVAKKNGRLSSTKVWWRKLLREWQSGRVEQACFLAFSMEAIQSTQNYSEAYPWAGIDRGLASFQVCIPSYRIRFVTPADDGELRIGVSPTHANAIAYLPPHHVIGGGETDQERFARAFRSIGDVMIPWVQS